MTVACDESVAAGCQEAVTEIDRGELQLRHVDADEVDRIRSRARIEFARRCLVDDIPLQPDNLAQVIVETDAVPVGVFELLRDPAPRLLVLSEVL